MEFELATVKTLMQSEYYSLWLSPDANPPFDHLNHLGGASYLSNKCKFCHYEVKKYENESVTVKVRKYEIKCINL